VDKIQGVFVCGHIIYFDDGGEPEDPLGFDRFSDAEAAVSRVGYRHARYFVIRTRSPVTGDLRRCGALLTTGWAGSSGSPDELEVPVNTCGPEIFEAVTQFPSPGDIHDVGRRALASPRHGGPAAIDVDGHWQE
jgi:hypothetical protein